MSKKNFAEMNAEERADWARKVKRIRQDAGLTQAQLADKAETSRQTINNLEKGFTPQGETLRKVLLALGLDVDGPEFAAQTERWLTTMGTLIEAIPSERRQKHVDIAIGDLAAGIRAAPDAELIPLNVSGRIDYEDPSWKSVANREDEGGVEEDGDQ